jgi:ribosomal-protein-alanine N-acetyltransferase
MNGQAVEVISNWEYSEPYSAYSFKGCPNGYLFDRSLWGKEQFCLMDGDTIVAQVACQLYDGDLWVGWSLAPELCGKGTGAAIIGRCTAELRRATAYDGPLYLRVAASTKRAVKAYQKAGFTYVKTIQDEIAYSDHMEDFWVMRQG